MISAAEIAAGLNGRASPEGKGWTARCPAHDDKHPSLSITSAENGKPLVRCHAGCTQEAVLEALRARGLWSTGLNGHDRGASPSAIPSACGQLGPYPDFWDYYDTRGRHVLRVCRWDVEGKKEIRPLSLQPSGAWDWKQLPPGRPLYRLPELMRDETRRVLVVEGEKTAERAATLLPNYVVTTWSGGANAAGKTSWVSISHRDVTLLPDNDAPGTDAMDEVAKILKTQGCTIRRVNPADISLDLPVGWDVADIHPDQDFDEEHLRRIVADAPTIHSGVHALNLRQAADIVNSPIPAAWLLRPYLEELCLALLYGELGTLKSFVTLDMLLSIAAGKAWGGSSFRCKPRPVVYVSAEGKGLNKRLQAWGLYHGVDLRKLPFYAIEHAIDLSRIEGLASLVTAIETLGIQPAVVGIDTLSRNAGALDENSTADMAGFVNALDLHLRQRLRCTVLLVHHTGHGAKDRARGSYSLMANTDANYRLERPDPGSLTVKFSTGRLKDSHEPDAIYMKAHVVNLGTADADGEPQTSLVLLPTNEQPVSPKNAPSGKQQIALLRLLEAEHRNGNAIWPIAEIRRLARDRLGMAKTTAQSAVAALGSNGFIKQTVGGMALTDPPEVTAKAKGQ
jgi:hypothetical protein